MKTADARHYPRDLPTLQKTDTYRQAIIAVNNETICIMQRCFNSQQASLPVAGKQTQTRFAVNRRRADQCTTRSGGLGHCVQFGDGTLIVLIRFPISRGRGDKSRPFCHTCGHAALAT